MPLRARRGDHLDGPLNVLTNLIGLLD